MNKRTHRIIIAIIFSLIFHLALLFLIDFFNWLNVTFNDTDNKQEPVTVVFPENKPSDQPSMIVDNQNENQLIPEKSNLLSEQNSKAQNPERTDQTRENAPFSEGNVDFPELSQAMKSNQSFKPPGYKPFSADALTGKQVDPRSTDTGENEEEGEKDEGQTLSAAGFGTNQRLQQKRFSVEEIGALSLSTYAWEWAPYIQKFKIKHQRVWTAPTAYTQLGLIHGYTIISFEIAKDGTLLKAEVLEHNGHESLEVSSLESIKAVFPFLPLPANFPEDKLSITARLVYPKWR